MRNVSALVKTLSVIFWGAEKPSGRRRLVLSVAFVILATSFVGYWADFIPSAEWNLVVIAVSGAFTLATLFWLIQALSNRPLKDTWIRDLLARVGGCIAVSLLVFWFSWLPLAQGVGYLVTLAIGQQTSQHVWLKKGGGRPCSFRLEGEALFRAVPSYLCISREQYDSLPAQETTFVLSGSQSWFGFIVTSWRAA
jgi:hypothetical protein